MTNGVHTIKSLIFPRNLAPTKFDELLIMLSAKVNLVYLLYLCNSFAMMIGKVIS